MSNVAGGDAFLGHRHIGNPVRVQRTPLRRMDRESLLNEAMAKAAQISLFDDALTPVHPVSGYSAKDIEVLEGLEPVRKRPGMYIGGVDERALHHLFAEVLDNAMDEAVAGHARLIEISLDVDLSLSVTTDGACPSIPTPNSRANRPWK